MEKQCYQERFIHLDGRTLRFGINDMYLDGVWSEQYQKAIITYSLFDVALFYGASPGGWRKHNLLHL